MADSGESAGDAKGAGSYLTRDTCAPFSLSRNNWDAPTPPVRFGDGAPSLSAAELMGGKGNGKSNFSETGR